jgi:hypothetical protein
MNARQLNEYWKVKNFRTIDEKIVKYWEIAKALNGGLVPKRIWKEILEDPETPEGLKKEIKKSTPYIESKI